MKNNILRLMILFLFFCSCNQASEKDMKKVNFLGAQLNIPKKLEIYQPDNGKINSTQSDLHFRNNKKTIFLNFKICSYIYDSRASYERLKKFFEEEQGIIEEEIVNLKKINETKQNKNKFYLLITNLREKTCFFPLHT